VNAVAQRLGLLPSTVSRWVREGKIPATQIDRRYYISEDDLMAFMDGRLVTTQQHRRITITHEAATLVENMAKQLDLPPFVVVECVIREAAKELRTNPSHAAALRAFLTEEP
jgi:excisionase family DNA binding protein